METIVVLGSNSFAGCWFVDAALSAGFSVVGINRSAEGPALFLPYRKNINRGHYRFYRQDINRDRKDIEALLSSVRPAYFVDFAGQGMVAESWQHPEQWFQTNIVAKVRLHDFLRRQTWLKKYVRVSTPEVYGSTDHLIKEGQPYNPSTPYAVSHAAIDMSLTAFFRQYRFPLVLTRFANFYGPGQQLYRIIPRTIIYNLDGKTLQLHGGGKSVRAFVFSSDVADGLLRVIQRGRIGETYHFSPERFYSIHEVVERICAKMKVDFKRAVEIMIDRPAKDQAYFMDATKAREELDWQPKVSLEAGIDTTIAWVRDNYSELKLMNWNYEHKA